MKIIENKTGNSNMEISLHWKLILVVTSAPESNPCGAWSRDLQGLHRNTSAFTGDSTSQGIFSLWIFT